MVRFISCPYGPQITEILSYLPVPPEYQEDGYIDQANPVSGTQYEVLATTPNARIIGIGAVVTWTVQPTPLEIWIAIDGQTIRLYVDSPTNNTWYNARIYEQLSDVVGHPLSTGVMSEERTFLIEGRSIRIQAETTGGTTSRLRSRVKWERWP